MVRVVFERVVPVAGGDKAQAPNAAPRPVRPAITPLFEAVRSSIGGAGVVALLVVAAYCHGLAHALQALQAELPDGTADALTH